MKILSKVTAIVLCSVMLLSMIPFSALAASSYPNTHVNTGNMAADIVAVAVTQAGYCEGSLSGNPSYASTNNYQKFGQWYDNNVDNIGVTYAAWCAAFVSWCANQAGVPSSVVYYHAYCPYGVNWFRNQGRFQYAASRGGSYTPKAGDIVYFAPAGSSTSSHVGIVRYVKNGYVYTVEGNTSGQNGEVNEGGGVFLKSYSLSYSRLYGYGIPAYTDNSGHKIQFDSNGGSAVASVSVKDGGTLTAPANPTRYGFNFVGWYCNPELTDPYDYSMKVTYGFTLYAKWEEAYWGANTNLMPVDGLLVKNDFQGTGQYIWPYYNDDGSVTMYNGVTNDSNWSWPSAYMSYENSFDSGNDAYIYVKYNATARFNATIDYLDADGNAQSVTLSQLAGYGTEDLPAGYQEFFVNFGQYAYDQGHLTTADGSVHSRNIKYTKVTYYVVGGLDDYVRLYDMKLTAAFNIDDPHANLMTNQITQDAGYGEYTYNDGTLSMNAATDAGYAVTLHPNKTFDPSDMMYLVSGIESNVPFNVSVVLNGANGEATMHWRNEFYPSFGLAEAPDALPAGNWDVGMDLNGYFAWNGGTVSETTIKSITITLMGKGSLTADYLQAHRGIVGKHISDGLTGAGSIWAPVSSLLPVSGELQYVGFQGTGESVWDYYNDDGSVTLYNTVDAVSYSWPSGYMNYKNAVDLNATPYIHLNYRASGAFNCELRYLDAAGEEHSVNLSQVAGIATTDFPAGEYDGDIDLAAYLQAQGHLPEDGKLKITRATYYVVGTKDDYVRLYDLCFTNVEPVVVPTISLQYPTLLLEGEIKMNVYFTIDQDIDLSKMGMLTWTSQPDVVDMATADAVIPGASYNAELGFFGVTTKGIPAQNLGDVVYFCIYVELEDGTYAYSKQVSYSPTTYAYNQLKGTSATAAAKSLYVAILNYGAAAQTYLGYNTDALINANLTDEMKGYVNEYSSDMVHSVPMPGADKQGALAGNSGFSAKRPSISLDGAFSINYYFTPNAEVDGEMTFYYWNAADFAAADVLSIDNATASYAMTNANGVYSAAISGIAAKDIDGALYACGVYTDVNGNTYSTGVLPYSLGFFCGNQVTNGTEKVQPLAAAIAVYGYYAASYFA